MNQTNKPRQIRSGKGWTFIIGGAVVPVWSFCCVTIKISASGYSPLTFAAAKDSLVAFVIFCIAGVSGRRIMLHPNSWPWLAFRGLTGNSLAYWGMFGSVPIEGANFRSILGNSQALIVARLATKQDQKAFAQHRLKSLETLDKADLST